MGRPGPVLRSRLLLDDLVNALDAARRATIGGRCGGTGHPRPEDHPEQHGADDRCRSPAGHSANRSARGSAGPPPDPVQVHVAVR